MSEKVENELVKSVSDVAASFGEVNAVASKPRAPRAKRSDAGAPRSGLALVKLVQASRLPVPEGCLKAAGEDDLEAMLVGIERVGAAVRAEVARRAEKLRTMGAP